LKVFPGPAGGGQAVGIAFQVDDGRAEQVGQFKHGFEGGAALGGESFTVDKTGEVCAAANMEAASSTVLAGTPVCLLTVSGSKSAG